MRPMTYAAAAVLVVVAVGCGPRDRRDTASTTDSVMTLDDSVGTDVSRQTGDVAHEVRENVTRDYAYTRRDEFKRDVNERIKRLDQEIADFEKTTKSGVDKARDSAVVDLRSARRSVARELNRLGAVTENTWDDVSAAINRSIDSLDMMLRAQRPDAKPMGGTGPS